MINNFEKQAIREKLNDYIGRFGSQNKAANSLKAISSATLSQIVNENWEQISDEMWRNLGAQIGYSANAWVAVETRDYKLLTALLFDAQNNNLVFAVTGEAGTGKSFAIRKYVESYKRAYLLHCCEFWNRKTFLQELLTSLGRDYAGYTVVEMMSEIVRALKSQENPLLILDEADKLSDQVLNFFITLYNQLEDQCGIVLIATDHLSKRIKRGLKLNKRGYNEIYSRIGRRFVELKGLSLTDISAVCQANGITDKHQVKQVVDDCENDLRRVKRKIHALKNVA